MTTFRIKLPGSRHRVRKIAQTGRYIIVVDGRWRARLVAQVGSKHAARNHARARVSRLRRHQRVRIIDMEALEELFFDDIPRNPKPSRAEPRQVMTQPRKVLPPAGWYSNPEGTDLRYWDGQVWTAYRRPR